MVHLPCKRTCYALLLLLIFSSFSIADTPVEEPSVVNADSGLDTDIDLSGIMFQNNPEMERKTSLKRFFPNLKSNFASVFQAENLNYLIAGSAAAGISSTADDEIHNYFQKKDSGGHVGNVGATLGKPYVVIPTVVGLLVAGQFSGNEKFRTFTYALAQAYTIDYALTTSMKYAVGRERPDRSNDRSLPSGHAADSFMVATVLHHYYGNTAGIIGYGVASFISASRLKNDVHWLSDLVVGATIGYIVGRSVSRNISGGADEPRFIIAPTIYPVRKGYGLNVTIRF